MKNLSKNILSTIVYYDVLDYPLTSFEVWKYLNSAEKEKSGCSLVEVAMALEDEELRKNVEEYQGFYFLCGRKDLVGQRIERSKVSERKFRLIKRIVFWLRFCPFVRMIAVTGRMAMKNAEAKSDLDFLIALKRGKIFTGRALITAVTHFLGLRRHGRKIKNRACLNFFLTDGSLEINLKDFFSSSEYSFVLPVFGWGVFREFQKSNSWIADFKPNFSPAEIPSFGIIKDSRTSLVFRRFGEKVLAKDFFENLLKKLQMKRIVNDPRTYQKGSGVIASDDSLVFLPDPHGPKIFEKFQEKMKNLSKTNALQGTSRES